MINLIQYEECLIAYKCSLKWPPILLEFEVKGYLAKRGFGIDHVRVKY